MGDSNPLTLSHPG